MVVNDRPHTTIYEQFLDTIDRRGRKTNFVEDIRPASDNYGTALKASLAAYGLRYAAGWHSTNVLVNDLQTEKAALQRFIDMTKAAGGDHINACECSNTVHGSDGVPVNNRPIMTDAQWEHFSKGYEALSQFAAEQGVKMGYHHHMGTIIESADDIDRFMAMAGPHTRLLLDTGHCTFGGADPAEVARKYMDRVTHIHCKNIRPEIMKRVRSANLSFWRASAKACSRCRAIQRAASTLGRR